MWRIDLERAPDNRMVPSDIMRGVGEHPVLLNAGVLGPG